MRLHRAGSATLLAIALAGSAHPAKAADPVAGTAPIKGSDAMGDKGRSGPDGFSWAPQTRDQKPADKTSQPSGSLNSQPAQNAGAKLKPGDDPGTPAAADSHGPGTMDAGTTHK